MPAGRTRKLPARDEVVRLYVKECFGTPQIARMVGLTDPHAVRLQLLRAGIKLRKAGGWGRPIKCIECGKPVMRVWHAKFQCWYGRRCEKHQRLHRKKVCASWGRRFRAKHPEIVKLRHDRWYQRLRAMSFEELLQTIKEAPCQIKKAELLRKMRKLHATGQHEEAIMLALKVYPTLAPKQASHAPTT